MKSSVSPPLPLVCRTAFKDHQETALWHCFYCLYQCHSVDALVALLILFTSLDNILLLIIGQQLAMVVVLFILVVTTKWDTSWVGPI